MDVKSAGRTVDLFEVFARTQAPLSLSDLARAIKAPLTSSLYLVRALEDRGYLYGVGGRRFIYPTRKLLDVARSIAASEPWMRRVEPVLLSLRDETEETVILGKRENQRVIYLAVLEGPQSIRYTARAGELKPLYSSSAGKALLSALDEPVRAKLVAKLRLEAVTEATITDREALLRELATSAARGYAETRGENVPDVMAVAKPARLGGELYAVVVAGPMHRMKKEVGPHLRALARAVAAIEAPSTVN